ncbi:MAG: protein DA1 [Chloroflexaceae bacterium]|jgi:hypothetical protein|nr:protein DA1 [Chloroflexaceae bacterium]
MATTSSHRTQVSQANECAICRSPLTTGYYTLLDRPERYCPTCIATRPRCACCGTPLGAQHWQLHDGRLQCCECHATAVYDPAVAREIFAETVTALVQQFGLLLSVKVEFRLIDAPTMQGILAQSQRHFDAGVQTLGLYQRQGPVRAIYMLYGLPRLLFRTTVAHEYAHAWQGEHCPRMQSDLLREGFAEWVAYRHLLWLGGTRAAQRMLEAQHPYRPALEHVLELEEQLGTVKLLDYMKRAH